MLKHRFSSRIAARTKRGMASGLAGGWIADFLVSYLHQGDSPDPYDFAFLTQEWARDQDIEVEDDLHAWSEKDVERFGRWLRSREGRAAIGEAAFSDPLGVPAYVHFSDVEHVDPNAWLMHFTNSSPFHSFDRGATLENLALTKLNRGKHVSAKCPDNLMSDKTGPFEVVFAFAFEVTPRFFFRQASRKYGSNAVLFQCDSAVVAFHHGDQEKQVIFPVCSERDAVAVYDVNGKGGGTIAVDGQEVEVDTFEDLVEIVEAKQVGRARGTTRSSPRWNARFIPPSLRRPMRRM